MNILFFDTETTGFPDDRLPMDHPDQPHVVQLAAQLCRDTGEILMGFSVIINPGVPIPARAAEIHGITTEIASELGISLKSALGLFAHLYGRAGMTVAHNIKFDRQLMTIAASRNKGIETYFSVPSFCTMEAATPIINLPPTDRMKAAGFNKPKPPKLEEAIRFFFDEPLDGAHDAMVDVVACRRVFFKLKELGHVPA